MRAGRLVEGGALGGLEEGRVGFGELYAREQS